MSEFFQPFSFSFFAIMPSYKIGKLIFHQIRWLTFFNFFLEWTLRSTVKAT